ncbi:MAG: cupin domain-containing protein [Bacteroidetes bacterium]|nr:MAG: cupin domain-containing protein [Bacteroidota bacterium]
MKAKNLLHLFEQVNAFWDPHVVADLNGQEMKVAKFKGIFPRHLHEEEDECFLVVKGHFTMRFDDYVEEVSEGSFIVVPKGVYHQPEAEEEAWVLLFEPASTLNTGNTENAFTKRNLKQL